MLTKADEGGGGGVRQKLTKADEGGGGGRQIMTFADRGGEGGSGGPLFWLT